MFKDLIQKYAPQFRSVEDIILQDNPDELLMDDLLSLWVGESNKDKNHDNLDYSNNPEALRRVLYAEIETGALKVKEIPYSNTRFATGGVTLRAQWRYFCRSVACSVTVVFAKYVVTS